MDIRTYARRAREASTALAGVDGKTRNRALEQISKALRENSEKISKANIEDVQKAQTENLAGPLLKRLKFDESKIAGLCEGLESLMELPDPVGRTISALELDEGLELFKVSCPIGVIGVIFESRPDALVQISSLCLKSGNAVLLKGGSEAANTNKVLAETITHACDKVGIPAGWLGLLETRADVAAMLELDEYIDLIIPRGSNEFVRHIMNNTNIPVLGHADGICHVYVDVDADLDMAVEIAFDSKCQYPAVCNAAETLLVHGGVAEEFLPAVSEKLNCRGVEIRGCEKTQKIINCKPADEQDWKTEYLDYILSVRVVDSFEQAVEHINTYGSGHTDTIVTANAETARRFMNLVDSADVFYNAGTRFSDGFRFGLGAEVGISTNKIHARGPVGLEGLLIYKWKLFGKGDIVGPYSSGEKKFTHKKIDKNCPF